MDKNCSSSHQQAGSYFSQVILNPPIRLQGTALSASLQLETVNREHRRGLSHQSRQLGPMPKSLSTSMHQVPLSVLSGPCSSPLYMKSL